MILSLKDQIFQFLDKDSTQSSTVIANSTTPTTSDSYVRRITDKEKNKNIAFLAYTLGSTSGSIVGTYFSTLIDN